jgi:hypothetical protein
MSPSVAITTPVPTPAEQASATPFEVPPPGGLSLAQALAALKTAGVGSGSATAVISARIARLSDIVTEHSISDRWVWVFVVDGVLTPASCGGPASAERCTMAPTTVLAIFDYMTGEFLEARFPAFP